MSSKVLEWYEIGIRDFRNVSHKSETFVSRGVSDLVFNDRYGLSYVPPTNKRKEDNKPKVHIRTIFRQAKSQNRAMRIAERLGTVIFCHKVKTHYHFEKIEHLNLHQVPWTIDVEPDDEFILNAQGELTPTFRATQEALERKYEVDFV